MKKTYYKISWEHLNKELEQIEHIADGMLEEAKDAEDRNLEYYGNKLKGKILSARSVLIYKTALIK